MLDKGLDKASWLDLIRAERVQWEAVLAEVGREKMETAGVVGNWSIKDLVSHVAFWEGMAARHLEAALQGAPPTPSRYKGLEIDEVNNLAYNENRDRPLEDVLEWSGDAHKRVVGAIEALSEEQLAEPGRYEWLGGGPLWEVVPGNTYEHYREHAETIRLWLGKA